jgi:hypothetical protein
MKQIAHQDAYHNFRSKMDYEGGIEGSLLYGMEPPSEFADLVNTWNRARKAYETLHRLLSVYDEEFGYESE